MSTSVQNKQQSNNLLFWSVWVERALWKCDSLRFCSNRKAVITMKQHVGDAGSSISFKTASRNVLLFSSDMQLKLHDVSFIYLRSHTYVCPVISLQHLQRVISIWDLTAWTLVSVCLSLSQSHFHQELSNTRKIQLLSYQLFCIMQTSAQYAFLTSSAAVLRMCCA